MFSYPIYNALIADEKDGIFAVSLVEYPATEEGWLAFSKQEEEKQPLYFVKDEDKRLITSVLMKADTPIYRISPSGFQYYIQYSKEVLKQMAEKVIADGTLNNVDIEHNGEYLPKGSVQCMELYIKDVERGINPVGFENVTDGSLFCTYKVNDDSLWETIKEGKMLNGFSLAGLFSISEEQFNKQQDKKESKMSKMKQLKTLLREILCEFGTIRLEDGTEVEIASDEIVEGVAIELEDGEYKTEDGKVIEVKEGVIVSIAEPQPKEEEVIEEPAEEEPIEEPQEEEKPEEVIEEEPKDEAPEEQPAEEVIEEPKEEEKPEEIVEEIVDVIEEPQEADPMEERISELERKLAEILAILKKPVDEGVIDEYSPEHKEEEVRPLFSNQAENYDKFGLKDWRKSHKY